MAQAAEKINISYLKIKPVSYQKAFGNKNCGKWSSYTNLALKTIPLDL